MMGRWIHRLTGVAGVFVLPFINASDWEVIQYSRIRPNTTTFSEAGLRIHVDRSAGSVAYRLPEPLQVTALRAHGRIEGQLRVPAHQQGSEGHDDFTLRLGLVEAGDTRLGRLARVFAPEWVRRLHRLAAPGQGIAGVRFFNLGVDASQIGQSRVHPLHELMYETIVAIPHPDGTFAIDTRLDASIEVVGIWIAADGDESESTFTLLLEEVTLETVPPTR